MVTRLLGLGQLDRLLRSGACFVQQAMVLHASRTGEAPIVAVRRIGSALTFERVWEETGCRQVIASLAAAAVTASRWNAPCSSLCCIG